MGADPAPELLLLTLVAQAGCPRWCPVRTLPADEALLKDQELCRSASRKPVPGPGC